MARHTMFTNPTQSDASVFGGSALIQQMSNGTSGNGYQNFWGGLGNMFTGNTDWERQLALWNKNSAFNAQQAQIDRDFNAAQSALNRDFQSSEAQKTVIGKKNVKYGVSTCRCRPQSGWS